MKPTKPRKLIEVALPLQAINAASSQEKSIRHGHPSTLHLYWSRKPLATSRAVLFAQLVDDPSAHPDRFPTPEAQAAERERLFEIIRRMVPWKNTNDPEVLRAARQEIAASAGEVPPHILDPFCGGGTIPLEAQRLGLRALARDLNPVAVNATRALIEMPPRFGGRAPVHPQAAGRTAWRGAEGLAADVERYGADVRAAAWQAIGRYYPTVQTPAGAEATITAWIWIHVARCPNPGCRAEIPLANKWALSSKKGKRVWIVPTLSEGAIGFAIQRGDGPIPRGTVSRRGVTCLACEQPAALAHVRAEAEAGRLSARLAAIVAQGADRSRSYLPADATHRALAADASAAWRPDAALVGKCRVSVPLYGMETFADLYSPRQLLAMDTFSRESAAIHAQIRADAVAAGLADDDASLVDGGGGARAYADAVVTYLACAVSRAADFWSRLATWSADGSFVGHTFVRQALPMVWDYAEANPFSAASGNWSGALDWIARVIRNLPAGAQGLARQGDAAASPPGGGPFVISTDPPYYDNICYADLSDYFYVWLRRVLAGVDPALFQTLQVPKADELVASTYRFDGDRDRARGFFEAGLQRAFERMATLQDPAFPMTVYYAFKQAEARRGEDGAASTGWETMLTGLLAAGFQITGTWPIRSERSARRVAVGANALASSIVLVCRARPEGAGTIGRARFVRALRKELPRALETLLASGVAPVDVAQASIGPGMAIFSRYEKILEPDGGDMTVRTALQLINHALDAHLTDQEGALDADSRFAVTWFTTYGFEPGPFGEAETLAKARNISVRGVVQAGLIAAGGGRVRLLRLDELPDDWDPSADARATTWEATHHLAKRLETGGERAAARLLGALGGEAEAARDLAYRLYNICDRAGWGQAAQPYNALVTAWPELTRLAASPPAYEQRTLL